MKKEDKLLTYDQAKELKFFCRNVVTTREDFYKVMEQANSFHERLRRMEKTCKMIEEYLGENIERFASFKDNL